MAVKLAYHVRARWKTRYYSEMCQQKKIFRDRQNARQTPTKYL